MEVVPALKKCKTKTHLTLNLSDVACYTTSLTTCVNFCMFPINYARFTKLNQYDKNVYIAEYFVYLKHIYKNKSWPQFKQLVCQTMQKHSCVWVRVKGLLYNTFWEEYFPSNRESIGLTLNLKKCLLEMPNTPNGRSSSTISLFHIPIFCFAVPTCPLNVHLH